MHVRHTFGMRTTVELSDDLRARLLDLAARRGEKGFSALVAEAVELYLEAEERQKARRERAQTLLGTLSDGEAGELEESVRALRGTWR